VRFTGDTRAVARPFISTEGEIRDIVETLRGLLHDIA
jgi:hypothetical protein